MVLAAPCRRRVVTPEEVRKPFAGRRGASEHSSLWARWSCRRLRTWRSSIAASQLQPAGMATSKGYDTLAFPWELGGAIAAPPRSLARSS